MNWIAEHVYFCFMSFYLVYNILTILIWVTSGERLEKYTKKTIKTYAITTMIMVVFVALYWCCFGYIPELSQIQ